MDSRAFSKNARVCFVGDSITANGGFIAKIFDYYCEKHPELGVKMFNCGIPGDSARGCIKRLSDDVYRFEPTEIVLMFGMNDCRRSQFALEDRSEAERITLKAKKIHLESMAYLCKSFCDHKLPITLCSATPYDQYSKKLTALNLYGCNDALIDYYSEYSNCLAEFDFKNKVDFNTPMVEIIKELEALGEKSIIGEDRVHPLAVGHDAMASIFLSAQGFDDVPSAWDICTKKAGLPDLSEVNKERCRVESLLRNALGYVDWNAQWGQENMNSTQRVEHWRAHRSEIDRSSFEFLYNMTLLYIDNKPIEKELTESYIALTDKMLNR